MGNTTVEWHLFAAAPLRERFWEAGGAGDEVQAQAALEACVAGCGRGEHRTQDVIHDMNDGLPWDLLPLLEEEDDDMAAAWEELWGALGKDGPPGELPWWVEALYPPDGWYVGLVTPGRAVKLQSALDASGLRERAGELLRARDPQAARSWVRLLELVDRAAADDCFLLAVESMS